MVANFTFPSLSIFFFVLYGRNIYVFLVQKTSWSECCTLFTVDICGKNL